MGKPYDGPRCGYPRRSSDKKPNKRGVMEQKGSPCRNPAGWGTNHVGVGFCRRHGGTSAPMQRVAARQMADMKARRELARFGQHVDISPAQALLAMVHEAAGNVAYLGARIDEMIELARDEAERLRLSQEDDEAEDPPAEGILGEVADFVDNLEAARKDAKKAANWQGTVPMSPGAGALFGPVIGATAQGDLYQQGEDQRAIMRLYGEWSDRLVKYSKSAIDAGVAKAQVELAKRQAEMIVFVFKQVLGKLALDSAQVKFAQEELAKQLKGLAQARIVDGSARQIEAEATAAAPIRKTRYADQR